MRIPLGAVRYWDGCRRDTVFPMLVTAVCSHAATWPGDRRGDGSDHRPAPDPLEAAPASSLVHSGGLWLRLSVVGRPTTGRRPGKPALVAEDPGILWRHPAV